MKKLLLPFAALCILASCKNGKDSGGEQKGDPALEEKASQLQKEVLEEHDIAMPKSMKIPDLEKEVSRLLDSVAGLPEKAKAAAAPLKEKLEKLKEELSYAGNAMDKWMTEFSLDSFSKDAAKRISYLTDEKLKVSKVKDAILNGLAKADSLLHRK